MRDRGIIPYMDPNCFFNPNFKYEKHSDIYSFGMLMWEISSGYPPFKDSSSGGDLTVLCLSIQNGARERLISGTPKEYEKLYKMCWNQEPKQRPATSVILDIFTKKIIGNNAINNENKADEGMNSILLNFSLSLYFNYDN
jgi:serine/threonine protein kinase